MIKDIEIHDIARKELIFKKIGPGKIDDVFEPILLPLLNEKNDIEGT